MVRECSLLLASPRPPHATKSTPPSHQLSRSFYQNDPTAEDFDVDVAHPVGTTGFTFTRRKHALSEHPSLKNYQQSLDSPARFAFLFPVTNEQAKAATLIEALPYLQRFRGETFLIKIGGSVMEDPQLVSDFMRDILFLESVGINPVLVHGGGKAISAAMAELGLEPEWVEGFRVTCEQAINLVEKTLTHTLSPQLVELLNGHGGRAVAIPGTNVFRARRMTPSGKDIGFVGEVESCLTEEILYATTSSLVPVISPLGREIETEASLNINADLAAAALAKALKPRQAHLPFRRARSHARPQGPRHPH